MSLERAFIVRWRTDPLLQASHRERGFVGLTEIRFVVERISLGGYFAEIVCDSLTVPPTWHCVIQQLGNIEVLFWAQEGSHGEAVLAADNALQDLVGCAGDKEKLYATIAEKKFMTLRATMRRPRSPQ
jgi:hypothetical protein